jgi:hypothetical protein
LIYSLRVVVYSTRAWRFVHGIIGEPLVQKPVGPQVGLRLGLAVVHLDGESFGRPESSR